MAESDNADSPCIASSGLQFILSSNNQKIDGATRKLIRSHVMRGRKQRNGSLGKGQRASTVFKPQPAPVKIEEVLDRYRTLVPNFIGTELPFVELADEVEPAVILKIIKVSPAASRVIFPLMAALSSPKGGHDWLPLVGSDIAALHVTIFAIESFVEKILYRRKECSNPAVGLHLQKGLGLLRQRLLGNDNEAKISDSTIAVVTKLATAAHFDGDYQASRYHMEGIRKMVDLRGGLSVFKTGSLLSEILRNDLRVAILNGSDLLFYCEPTEPVIDYPARLLPSSHDRLCSETSTQFPDIDMDLAIAWKVLRKFCFVVNLGSQTQRWVQPEIIFETMTAVIYRLLRLQFPLGSSSEAIRYGLLAFSYHVFLQWQDVKLPHQHFSTAFRKSITDFEATDNVSPQLMLWLWMTGALSVLEISQDAVLRERLRHYKDECKIKAWRKMRGILKSFMWIDSLDEECGKGIHDLI